MLLRAAVVIAALAGCGGGRVNAPPPQAPIAAEPDPPARPATEVCGDLVADLDKWGGCVPDERRAYVYAWRDHARTTFEALAHDGISDAERGETARACGKADDAVRAALAACPAR